MPRACKIIIVPEDSEHANLARGYFAGRDVSPGGYQVTRNWTGKNGNFDRVRDWLVEEIRFQARGLVRFGVLALIDEDGQGLSVRRQNVINHLTSLGLPTLDPSQGRLLVLPVRNVETWMVWGARWAAAGKPTSPNATTPAFPNVDETHDYKRWQARDGKSLSRESRLDAYQLGRTIATLNRVSPPNGLPPALQAILHPLSDFLDWARV